jgi:hypothetical protein
MAPPMRPNFVGSQWLLAGQGFAYEGNPPEDLGRRVDDDDEWIRLLAMFERLKQGALEHDVALFKLIAASEHSDIRVLGLTILRHTASRTCRLGIAEFFQHADVDTRTAAYDAALYSADLRLVEPLLLAHRNARGDERFIVMHALSHLLEGEPDQLYDDTDEFAPDAYGRIAGTIRHEVEAKCGSEAAVFEGRLLSLPYILERIELLCGNADAIEYSGTISMYFDLFEAMTGQSSVGVFDENVTVDPHYAINLVDEFQETGKVVRFIPGQRYFFGHKLSS